MKKHMSRFLVVTGFWGGLMAWGTLEASPRPVDVLWNQVIDAHGRKAIETLDRLITVQEMSGDVEGVATFWYTSTKYKAVTVSPIGTEAMIGDLKKPTVRRDANGFLHVLEPREIKESKTNSFLEDLPFSLTGVPITLLATATVEEAGRAWHTIDLSVVGGEGARIWVDPATTLVAKSRVDRDADTLSIEYSAYKKADGLVTPWLTHIRQRQGQQTMTRLSLALNPTIPDQEFEPLTPGPSMVEWPKGKDRLTMPAQLLPNGQVMIQVRIGEDPKPRTFLVDSGAAGSMVNDRLLRGQDVRRAKAGRAVGFGTENPLIYMGRVPSLKIDDLIIRDRVVAITERLPQIDGILGYDFFRGVVFEVSLADRTVSLMPADRYVPPPGALTLPIRFGGDLPIVQAEVNGAKDVQLMVDMGFDGEVSLFRSFVKKHGWAERPGGMAGGIGGMERAGLVTLTHFRIGATGFPRIEAMVMNGSDTQFDGLMGPSMFLRVKTFAFDYEHKRIVILPKPWLGIRFAAAREAVVQETIPGSSARGAGLEEGDVIVRIADTEIADRDQLIQFIAGRNVGDTLELTLRRGVETIKKTLTLTSSFQ